MQQQVNLYQPIYRDERKLFSATAIGTGLAIVACGLAALGLLCWWQVVSLERDMRDIEVQNVRRDKLIAIAAAVLERGESEHALSDRLNALALELEHRQQALRYLTNGAAGSRVGFAGRMEALARQQVDGLWLSGATFNADSARFALAGSAVNAELVPRYLARLANEPALAGAKLESLEISQPKPPGALRPDGSRAGDGQSRAQGTAAAPEHIDFVVSSTAQRAGSDSRLAMAGDLRGAAPAGSAQ